jgi:hypothetical protein
MAQRLTISFRITKYENGKELERKYIRTLPDAFPLGPKFR